MATKAQVSIEEYLRMSFDGPDREYRDGEIVERNVGEKSHGTAQWRLGGIFFGLSSQKPFWGVTELRLRVGENDYLIPDLAVFAPDPPTEAYPSTPPYVVVEVLSPDDRMKAVREKLEAYRIWGVRYVWLVDPYSKAMYELGDHGLRQVTSYRLAEYDVEITPAQIFGESGINDPSARME